MELILLGIVEYKIIIEQESRKDILSIKFHVHANIATKTNKNPQQLEMIIKPWGVNLKYKRYLKIVD